MRVLSFAVGGRSTFGAVSGDGVVDLGLRLDGKYRDLRDAITRQALAELADAASGASADHALTDIRFLKPIPYPEKIVCIGVNYANRNEEYKDSSEAAPYPSVFLRVPDSMVGHDEPFIRPRESEQLDYEGEIGLIIGKSGRRIPPEKAGDYVAGVTCVNEGAVRDWMRHGKFNVTQGKNFDATGSVGPWMVTTDEVDPFNDELQVTARVNGDVRQHDTTANLIFDFRYLVNYVSTFMTLTPGDIISTGTPIGAGARMDPPQFLKPGDEVEVEVSRVGILANSVVDG